MKWCSAWWGVEITADNEKDEKLLRQMISCLNKKPESSYEDGELEINKEPEKYGVGYAGLTLTFKR